MPVTIRDIAEALGCSPSTVSDALNNKGKLRPQTREKIKKEAARLGYHIPLDPNGPYRDLVGRPVRILLYQPNIHATEDEDSQPTSTFQINVIRGIEDALHHYGMVSFICTEKTLQVRSPKDLVGTLCVGGDLRKESLEVLEASDSPTVMIGTHSSSHLLSAVEPDAVQGIRMAVNHLYELGHRSIALLNSGNHTRTSDDKLTGFVRSTYDLKLPADYIYSYDPRSSGRNHWSSEVERLLNSEWSDVTAIVCANEGFAVRTLQIAAKIGLSVPERLSVMGYHDHGKSVAVNPPLTTVSTPEVRLGKIAVTHLVASTINPDLAGTRLLVEPALTVRESTAPPWNLPVGTVAAHAQPSSAPT